MGRKEPATPGPSLCEPPQEVPEDMVCRAEQGPRDLGLAMWAHPQCSWRETVPFPSPSPLTPQGWAWHSPLPSQDLRKTPQAKLPALVS